ncbi:hypothetical protein G5T42_17080 [Microbacterium sp. 4R-513]|uniref:hypothetical protein n=1 Tax=Microbacterium sp. 4R-513 TaxID=2567934 RepID=UPI0013E1D1CD|nr:hypothetical protein [Microbacterium sp. 4R-513]QIG40973.1 hypothetical protein G5T42_17080 [Microbacterium sp. 4R-513]
MHLKTLRNAPPFAVRRVRIPVSLEDDDLIRVVGEYPRRQESRDAAPEHHRPPQSGPGDPGSLPGAEAGEDFGRGFSQWSLLSESVERACQVAPWMVNGLPGGAAS